MWSGSGRAEAVIDDARAPGLAVEASGDSQDLADDRTAGEDQKVMHRGAPSNR
ncbi:hypothetical protein [Komagataeibacter medellinensis]|uniref:hypothetical protein n=1 Tax=Komagataeibacter medellinensis TaxID=1177712 RepID=UPI00130546F8|nr:hypothetical protein [Komagataeibacter medellinensis]